MTVLMISPGYPAEMAFFTRGLGQAGVRVIGLGDQSPDALPAEARGALDHYVHTGSLAAEDHVAALVRGLARHTRIDQVECLWEPYMVLAARLREELGLPGLTVEQTVPFRDKERMKQLLDAAGLRTPWHVAARTVADVWAAAERVGYPAHRQAHRRGRVGGHRTGPIRPPSSTPSSHDQARAAGQRGGVRRRPRSSPTTPSARAGTSWSRTSASTTRGRW
jgi:Biotin carboxylase